MNFIVEVSKITANTYLILKINCESFLNSVSINQYI